MRKINYPPEEDKEMVKFKIKAIVIIFIIGMIAMLISSYLGV